jgi:hypothetical protein
LTEKHYSTDWFEAAGNNVAIPGRLHGTGSSGIRTALLTCRNETAALTADRVQAVQFNDFDLYYRGGDHLGDSGPRVISELSAHRRFPVNSTP